MLKDIRAAVQKAIDEGTTLKQFQKELKPLLQKKGWWGKVPDPSDPTKEVQLGSVRRLEKIYTTNLRTSYQAGRYANLEDNAAFRPYWQYIAVMDDRTRKEHKELHGKVFRHDDPFWENFFPPNGWNCRCTVKSLSQKDLDRLGLTVENSAGKLRNATAELPDGTKVQGKVYRTNGKIIQTDVGWNYNPGRSTYQPHDDGKDPELKAKFEELGAGKDPTAWEKPLINKIISQTNQKGWEAIKHFNIKYREVEQLKKELTEEDIIKKLSGGDLTNGSCVSLALSYIGNKLGFNVLDFRGGKSRLFFSYSSKVLCKIAGAHYNLSSKSLPDAIDTLKRVEECKEYFFAAGRHAAIVRKTNDNLEYLELQSSNKNGFKPLNETVLEYRFYAKHVNLENEKHYYTNDCLFDITDLKNKPEFRELLGYLNTYKNKELKGSKGYEK